MTTAAFTAAAICRPGDERVSHAIGHHRIFLTGAETGGRIGVWEEVVEPGWGPPLHIHHAEDELFYVLEGCVRIWCGEECFEATAGASVVLPCGIPHRFQNTGDTTARMLIAVTPGGFETFFLDAVELSEKGEAGIMKLAADYKLSFLPLSAEKAA